MPTTYLLDSGPLGLLAPTKPARYTPIRQWLLQEKSAGATFYIPEVADYEVRRELARMVKGGQFPASRLHRLDQLTAICTYSPVSTMAWRKAAELWADARCQGMPTSSPHSLDADVLVAAQAMELSATVITNNASHIGRWVPVHVWP
jgi:predicted nucleic acid-binding protein